VFGDSLTVGTIVYGSPSYLGAAMRTAHLTLAAQPSARVGRRVGEGLALLPSVPSGRRTVLIALGTNDLGATATTSATWIRRARELVGADVEIFWVNISLTGSRYRNQTQVNAGLLAGVRADDAWQAATGRVGRSHVLDWSSYARDHHVANRPDGMHYSLPNYRIRAIFYAESLAADPRFLQYRLG
jgi:lysophospholipase L1-like esterase